MEPLALLVHPQQPISYVERLIQAELPVVEADGGGHESYTTYQTAYGWTVVEPVTYLAGLGG